MPPPQVTPSITAGGSHTCAVRANGTLSCWGGDSHGQVSGAPQGRFTAVSAGAAHSCAIRDDGTLACWGDDAHGQSSGAPAGAFTAVSAGAAHSCAIRDDGTLACWGDDAHGQSSGAPAGEFSSVSAGGEHSCAVRVDGDVLCWGEDSFGQASGGPNAFHKHNNEKHHHHDKDEPPKFASVAAGQDHTCAIAIEDEDAWTGPASKEVVCWGDDSQGQVSGAPSGQFAAVAAGAFHNCGLRDNGTVSCWGEDSDGQVSGAPPGEFIALGAGAGHSCAITQEGHAECWGDDSQAQLRPRILGGAPPRAVIGAPYSYLFKTTAQQPAPAFSVTAGAPPPGLSLSGEGALTGEPTAAGEFSFSIAAANRVTDDAAREVEVTVVGPPSPSAATASAVTTRSATLQASVDPQNLAAEAWFEYWRADAPADVRTTPVQQLPSGVGPVALEAAIQELADGTEYGFRLAARNELSSAAVLGPVGTLTTRAVPVIQVVDEGLPPPVAGQTVNLEPVEGTVGTDCQGEGEFDRLLDAEQVPVGCLVDTRAGTVALTASKGSSGETQTADFWAGVFRVTQKAGDDQEAVMRLAGRRKCEKRKPGMTSRARASARRRGGRRLWGSGKGNYKTVGSYGSASVRGTTWLVVDRCDNSTFIKVGEGTVWVRDFVKDTSTVLETGDEYLAKAPIPRLR